MTIFDLSGGAFEFFATALRVDSVFRPSFARGERKQFSFQKRPSAGRANYVLANLRTGPTAFAAHADTPARNSVTTGSTACPLLPIGRLLSARIACA
jgi:hypothetical protein